VRIGFWQGRLQHPLPLPSLRNDPEESKQRCRLSDPGLRNGLYINNMYHTKRVGWRVELMGYADCPCIGLGNGTDTDLVSFRSGYTQAGGR
jgi:hypothetical protein